MHFSLSPQMPAIPRAWPGQRQEPTDLSRSSTGAACIWAITCCGQGMHQQESEVRVASGFKLRHSDMWCELLRQHLNLNRSIKGPPPGESILSGVCYNLEFTSKGQCVGTRWIILSSKFKFCSWYSFVSAWHRVYIFSLSNRLGWVPRNIVYRDWPLWSYSILSHNLAEFYLAPLGFWTNNPLLLIPLCL